MRNGFFERWYPSLVYFTLIAAYAVATAVGIGTERSAAFMFSATIGLALLIVAMLAANRAHYDSVSGRQPNTMQHFDRHASKIVIWNAGFSSFAVLTIAIAWHDWKTGLVTAGFALIFAILTGMALAWRIADAYPKWWLPAGLLPVALALAGCFELMHIRPLAIGTLALSYAGYLAMVVPSARESLVHLMRLLPR